MKKGKIIMTTVAIIVLAGLGYFKGMGIYSSSKVMDIGVKEGKLKVCIEKPNCVSTTNTNKEHKTSVIVTNFTLEEIIEKLIENDLELIKSDGNYAHFTHTSTLMSYVDDIEIMLNDNELSIRSASRVGYSDMGKNRERVELIRDILK